MWSIGGELLSCPWGYNKAKAGYVENDAEVKRIKRIENIILSE